MAGVHEDFGEKIGGAKKDLWKDRGLYADDLEAMNEREAEKFVKKDNVWKKPDYAAILEEGIPLGVVYFIKKARDGLNASPQYYRTDDTPEKRTARQKEYIKTVRELQAVLSDVRTAEDAVRAYDRFFVDNGYLEKVQGWGSGIHYRATKKGQDNPVITNKLSNTMLIRSAEYFERNFTQKAKKEQFCVSKEQKIPKGYAIHFNDGKHTYSKNEDWKPGTYYVTKGYSILRTNFETKEAALKWVQELAKGRNKNGKIRFVPPQLAHVKRTGPDYRNGVEITGQHYLDTFGFRGGEFGNWMNQNDRQTSLNMGFEALKDLASALKISDKDIAYQGTLAIAFGARGSGNAAAHYEPLRTVINLTKMHGAGSLAHEWWHGLDDYLGTKMGAKGMLSEQPRLYAPFQKLIDTMNNIAFRLCAMGYQSIHVTSQRTGNNETKAYPTIRICLLITLTGDCLSRNAQTSYAKCPLWVINPKPSKGKEDDAEYPIRQRSSHSSPVGSNDSHGIYPVFQTKENSYCIPKLKFD